MEELTLTVDRHVYCFDVPVCRKDLRDVGFGDILCQFLDDNLRNPSISKPSRHPSKPTKAFSIDQTQTHLRALESRAGAFCVAPSATGTPAPTPSRRPRPLTGRVGPTAGSGN